MWRATISTILSAGVSVFIGASAIGQTNPAPQTQPSYYISSGGTLSGTVDIANAEANAAAAKVKYDQAYAALNDTVANVRREFQVSPEFAHAKRELDDAQKDYDAATQVIHGTLATDPEYKELTQRKTEIEVALRSPTLPYTQRLDLANQKMQIGSILTDMEQKAFSENPQAQAAQQRLLAARQAMRELIDQFEADLPNNPDISAAKSAFDQAKIDLAQSQAYLQGAYVDRADAMAAQQSQPDSGYGVVAPYSYPWGYPGYGYYGFYGYPGLGTPYVIIGGQGYQHQHHNGNNGQMIGPGGGNLTGIMGG
jgi:uncharacterized protein involved in exopolysaccharide biosynthesis